MTISINFSIGGDDRSLLDVFMDMKGAIDAFGDSIDELVESYRDKVSDGTIRQIKEYSTDMALDPDTIKDVLNKVDERIFQWRIGDTAYFIKDSKLYDGEIVRFRDFSTGNVYAGVKTHERVIYLPICELFHTIDELLQHLKDTMNG